ncbi:MAG TPA: FGGY-family carbohydrate kinase [Streptosporangiaceae bacterium]|nr:FGGY-family carbohydrate kinase [Streptosporangiaceae bacterium]
MRGGVLIGIERSHEGCERFEAGGALSPGTGWRGLLGHVAEHEAEDGGHGEECLCFVQACAQLDDVFGTLMREALAGEADGGGLLAYNYLSGEPITGMTEGRPLLVRTPDSRLTLANLARAQVYSAFATLSLGMRVLAQEGVELDSLFAQGGIFRTQGVAQRLLAAALRAPVAVGRTAGEGGAGGSFLAAYLGTAPTQCLEDFLSTRVFADASFAVIDPCARDVEGFAAFLDRYLDGLEVEQVATRAVPGGLQ